MAHFCACRNFIFEDLVPRTLDIVLVHIGMDVVPSIEEFGQCLGMSWSLDVISYALVNREEDIAIRAWLTVTIQPEGSVLYPLGHLVIKIGIPPSDPFRNFCTPGVTWYARGNFVELIVIAGQTIHRMTQHQNGAIHKLVGVEYGRRREDSKPGIMRLNREAIVAGMVEAGG